MTFLDWLKIPFFMESIPEAPEWAFDVPDEYVMEDSDFIADLVLEEENGTVFNS